jgi:hypothetical protein
MAAEMSVEDTPGQKAGRALIVASGILLAAVVSQIGQRADVPGTLGSEGWWKAVLAAAFDPRGAGPIVWALVALFGLGNALNLRGLGPALRGFRFSIGPLMAAVALAGFACFLLRFWPPAGLVLILMASLSPARVVKSVRRREMPR